MGVARIWQHGAVRIVTETTLASVLGGLAATPRVVVSGNFATPWQALEDPGQVRRALPLVCPERPGRHPRPGRRDAGVPVRRALACGTASGCGTCRAGCPWCRTCLRQRCLPTSCSCTSSAPIGGTVSLGTEVNILPAAIEAVRAAAAWSLPRSTRRCRTATAMRCCPRTRSTWRSRRRRRCRRPAPRAGHTAQLHESIGARVAALVPGGRHAPARDRRACPMPFSPPCEPPRPVGVVGDVQRRRAGARAVRLAGPTDPGDGVVRLRRPRALRLDRPQSADPDAADREDQRSRA